MVQLLKIDATNKDQATAPYLREQKKAEEQKRKSSPKKQKRRK